MLLFAIKVMSVNGCLQFAVRYLNSFIFAMLLPAPLLLTVPSHLAIRVRDQSFMDWKVTVSHAPLPAQ